MAASIASLDTVDAMKIELPLNEEPIMGNDVKLQAEGCSPIPARKKTIKKHTKQGKPGKEKEDSTSAMKAMKAMKAVKTLKKPAASLPQNLQDYKLTTMDYKTGACAVRVVGGKQLFQVSRFSLSVNKKHAKNFLERLKGGVPLDKVLQMKDNL